MPLLAGLDFGLCRPWRRRRRSRRAAEIPPILFVHGNGDHAALWITTLWRMESNGVPRERMFAINFTDPLARTDDKVEQPNRSSTEDQRRELADAIKELKQRTGASRVALVGNSRGGNPIRNVIKNGGGGDVSHAVLCGVPNHGVFDWDENLGSEFNGRGPFLRGLNEGENEVTAGHRVPHAAQRRHRQICASRRPLRRQAGRADRRDVGRPGAEGRHQSGAGRDRSSRDRVSSARLPRDLQIHRRPRTVADRDRAGSRGQIERAGHGHAGRRRRPTVRCPAPSVDVYRVSAETGERSGGPIHSSQTGADGRWGPAQVDPSWYLEIVLTSPGSTTTHFYRSPFPRSSDIVHLRAARPLGPADAGAGAVVLMSRPRGYFGLPRDVVLLDGKEPTDVKPGVPTDSVTTLRLPAAEAGRPVVALFNEERIVARAWPASENRIAVAELTY